MINALALSGAWSRAKPLISIQASGISDKPVFTAVLHEPPIEEERIEALNVWMQMISWNDRSVGRRFNVFDSL